MSHYTPAHARPPRPRGRVARGLRALIRLIPAIPATLIPRRALPRAAAGAPSLPPRGAPGAPAATVAPVRPAGAPLQPPHAATGEVTAPAPASGAAARPAPTYAVRRDGIIAVSATGSLAVIPDRRDLPVARCRQTTALEALAMPAAREWATGTATLERLRDALAVFA